MDFDLTDEQRLLRDSLQRLLRDRYAPAQRRQYAAAPEGFSRAMWSEFAELGLLGLPFAEADGGFGGGPTETMIVMEELGRRVVVEPYFAIVILAGGVLRHGASEAQRAALVPGIVAGDILLAFAHAERQSRHDIAAVATTARRDGGDWILDGAKTLVLAGDAADQLIVSARSSGEGRARDGISLFLVDAAAPGLTRRGYPTQDGQRAAEIVLADVRAILLGSPGIALHAIERAIDGAIAALCAEAVGVMAAMHDLTLDYLRQRRQFGRPIGEFQVLQHRAVDMFVALEQARSMAMFAAVQAEAPDPLERRRAISAAKVQIGRSGRLIGQEAVQLHGGIGMTMDYALGHAFRRMTMIDLAFGDADFHLARLAELGGLFTTEDAA